MIRTIAVAVGVTAAQITVAAALSGQSDPIAAWRALFQHDGGWFRSVVEGGYGQPPVPSFANPGNVAFFPAYPLLARAVAAVTGLPTEPALLIVAPLACVGFWVYFQLLLKRWNTPPVASAACLALVAAHPAAFFLVASYSESTFLCALTGFVYWSGRAGPMATVLAALHGFAMTAARLVGVPVAAYPLLRAWYVGGWARAAVLTAAAALGAGLFVLYLRIEFGRWDATAASHAAGWGVVPDSLALFRLKNWALRYTDAVYLGWDVAMWDRLFVPLTALHFLLLGGLELLARRGGRRTRWRDRVPLYAVAFGLFVVPVMSHSTRGLSSLTRFALCWDAVLVLALAGLLADRPEWAKKRWVLVVLLGGAAWFASVQLALVAEFTRGVFVG